MKNYYEILEVNSRASQEVIENAYKVLIAKYSSNIQKETQSKIQKQKIQDIKEAYYVLSNDFLREQYDLEWQKQENKIKKTRHDVQKDNVKGVKPNYDTNNKIQNKVGILGRLMDLLAQFRSSRPPRKKLKDITKVDVIAVVLTIVAVIILGIILWFIPFTNGWMREILFENPLFNWIGGIFS